MRTSEQLQFGAGKERVPLSSAARIGIALSWVFVIALLPNKLWLGQVPSIALLLLLSWQFRLDVLQLIRRCLWLMPFVALAGIGLFAEPDGPVRVSNMFFKAALSLWVMTLLAHLTTLTEFVLGLRRLGFPGIWVELLAFFFRYFGLLAEEWQRMELARQARTFQRHSLRQSIHLAQSLGWLFVRAYERAERIHQAMLSRGYGGS